MDKGRFRDMCPFTYTTFRKTAYCLLNIINPLKLLPECSNYIHINLIVKKIVMRVTCEYMTSSDQIPWIFSRLHGPIYSVQLILLKLKVQHIYSFCNYFMNSSAYVVKTSLIRLVLFHPLNTFLPDIKSLHTH